MTRNMRLLWLVSALLYAGVLGYMGRSLYFWWDEWAVLRAGMESPGWGLLQDNGGNFFPLGRAIFLLETKVFGNWFSGYVIVSALLAAATAYLFAEILDNGTRARRIAMVAVGLMYLGSSGTLFAVGIGFMVKWILTVFFTAIAVYFAVRWRRRGGTWLAFGAFALSALTFASPSIPLSIVACATIVVVWLSAAPRIGRVLTGRRLLFLAGFVAIAVIVSAIGTVLVSMFPSVDPEYSRAGVAPVAGYTELSRALAIRPALVSTWMSAPLTYLPLIDRDMVSRLAYGLMPYPILVLAATLVIAGLIAAAGYVIVKGFRRVPKEATGWVGVLDWLGIAGVFVIPLVVFVAELFVVRPDDVNTVRYVTIWFWPAALFWVFIATGVAPRAVGVVKSAVLVLLVAVGAASLIMIPSAFDRMARLERDRLLVSPQQVALLKGCDTGTAESVRDVVFSAPLDSVCRIYMDLRDNSLIRVG